MDRPVATPVVAVPADTHTQVVTEMRAPFFGGLELRFGTSSVRDSGAGVGVALDAFLGQPLAGRLQPYGSVHLAQTSVDGTIGATPYVGSVTSYGTSAGLRLRLPQIRSVVPGLSVGVSAVAGGTRGDTPAQATVVEDLYGGFVMGPRVALTTEWDRVAGSSLRIMGSVGRLWAGPRGGWTVQAGVRWSRPARPRTVVRPSGPPAAESSTAGRPAADVETAADTTSPAPPVTASPSPDSALVARLEALESALANERQARERAQLAVDSVAAESRAARTRADSLAAAAAATASAAERRREAAQARREELRRNLQALVGVVPDVQSVRATERGLEVVIGGGLFPTGATTLSPEARAQVERVGRVLVQAQVRRLMVDGHTDSTGADETNRLISRLRAEAVRDVFASLGFPPAAITVIASGEGSPVADNATRDGRTRNRRVEIVILDDPTS
jgi:outer membrane protein OmpA-like peptidoglycan-associated protein